LYKLQSDSYAPRPNSHETSVMLRIVGTAWRLLSTRMEQQKGGAMQELAQKVILVTGAARGLGAAICRSLCSAGAHVVAADIRRDLLGTTVDKLRSSGGKANTLELDLLDEAAISRAVEQSLTHTGKLDVIVNNAGVDVTLPVDELKIEDWDRVIATNLRAPFLMAKAAIPIMKRQRHGYIVNIVSTAAKRAWPNASAYHASKWGLLGLSHALHSELRPHQIKVTAVICGGMKTPFLLDRFPDIDVTTLQDPENVADAIRFLLTQPAETVIPELMVLPMRETSWP
jgi:NAD(P)-dependent dehydrogenase (short-subunit alcohol dehydrogenase family)